MISFVVPAYDEEKHLPATLSALHAAARELGLDYEIVVADDGSDDATASVALAAGARVISVHHRQIAATRNSGARASRGELLVFVDADTRVSSAVLQAVLEAVSRGVLGGGAAVRFDEPVPRGYAFWLPLFVTLYRWAGFAGGCFMFCTRQAFDAVGGFDETLFASEEVAFSRALRRRGRFELVKESVVTSGRKLRAYRPREIWGALVRAGVDVFRPVRDRRRLDLWYGARRADPGESAQERHSG